METDVTIAFRPAPQTAPMTAPVHELAFRMVAAFRAHPHINNVLTHVSRSDWAAVERALRRIFDPGTTAAELSLLELNLVDLMHAERGVTGRILKPFMRDRLGKFLKPKQAEEILAHVESLFVRSQGLSDVEPLGCASTVRASFDLAAS